MQKKKISVVDAIFPTIFQRTQLNFKNGSSQDEPENVYF